jgi:hypothetical protein
VTEKEQQKAVSELKKIITKDRLLGTRNVANQVDMGETSVEAAWQGNFPIPGFAAKFLLQNNLTVQVSWSSEKAQPAAAIRKIRGVRKLINGGTN